MLSLYAVELWAVLRNCLSFMPRYVDISPSTIACVSRILRGPANRLISRSVEKLVLFKSGKISDNALFLIQKVKPLRHQSSPLI